MIGMIFAINSVLKFLNHSVQHKQLFKNEVVWPVMIFFRKENMSQDYLL